MIHITSIGAVVPMVSGALYTVPVLRASHKHAVRRPMVSSQVSGASGEFDHFSASGNPITPQDFDITFDVKATSYTGIDTELEKLSFVLAATWDTGTYPVLAYAEDRSGNQYYTRAKMTEVQFVEEHGLYLKVPISCKLRIPGGLWYSALKSATLPSGADNDYILTAADVGNYHMLPTYSVTEYPGGSLRVLYIKLSARYQDVVLYWNDVYSGSEQVNVDVPDYEVRDFYGVDIFGDANRTTTVTYTPWLFASLPGQTFGISSFVAGSEITGATNATPIVITTGVNHGLSNGDSVTVQYVTGNTAANGTWAIANITANTFELVGSVGNGAFVAGAGQWYQGGTISGITAGAAPNTVTTTIAHGLITGERVSLLALSGAGITAPGDSIFVITVTGANTFTITAVVSGAYTTGAAWALADYELIVRWDPTYVT